VLVEAMSFGLPVIAVDAWAMPEIVQDGVNGYLIPPGSLEELVDRMLLLSQDQGSLRALSEGAHRAFRERFSILRHNERLKRVYDACLRSV
jgi:glycosyltransferase involved in cell wall biosynthesis